VLTRTIAKLRCGRIIDTYCKHRYPCLTRRVEVQTVRLGLGSGLGLRSVRVRLTRSLTLLGTGWLGLGCRLGWKVGLGLLRTLGERLGDTPEPSGWVEGWVRVRVRLTRTTRSSADVRANRVFPRTPAELTSATFAQAEQTNPVARLQRTLQRALRQLQRRATDSPAASPTPATPFFFNEQCVCPPFSQPSNLCA